MVSSSIANFVEYYERSEGIVIRYFFSQLASHFLLICPYGPISVLMFLFDPNGDDTIDSKDMSRRYTSDANVCKAKFPTCTIKFWIELT